MNSLHKGQWRGALMFSLICAWINRWVNYSKAGDLRRHRAHYDVIVMKANRLFRNSDLNQIVVHLWSELMILAWAGDELLHRQAPAWYTHTHTHTHTDSYAGPGNDPEGQRQTSGKNYQTTFVRFALRGRRDLTPTIFQTFPSWKDTTINKVMTKHIRRRDNSSNNKLLFV